MTLRAKPLINNNENINTDDPKLVISSLVVGNCDICGNPIDNMKGGFRTAADGKIIWHPTEEAQAQKNGWTL